MNSRDRESHSSSTDTFLIRQAIKELRALFDNERDFENISMRTRNNLTKPSQSLAEQYNDGIAQTRAEIKNILHELILYPPHHIRHYDKRGEFHSIADYEESIFIMTKFPREITDKEYGEEDKSLTNIVETVRSSVKECKHCPRLASDHEYHDYIWDNVELYLICCSKGIAIVEDRYRPELNPNVAMEWGWMRAMGKNVLYLMEETFQHDRADWRGLDPKPFSWESPKAQIDQAIEKWLDISDG